MIKEIPKTVYSIIIDGYEHRTYKNLGHAKCARSNIKRCNPTSDVYIYKYICDGEIDE